MSELHAVFMTVEGSDSFRQFRVSPWISHDAAIKKWNAFESWRRQGRILGGHRTLGFGEELPTQPVKFFEVRAYDDPSYGSLKSGAFYWRPKWAYKLGYKDRFYAYAKIGKQNGYVGNTGGWIKPGNYQGWENLYRERLYNLGYRVFKDNGRYFVWSKTTPRTP